MDLSIDIASFNKKLSQTKSASFKVGLESGHLSVHPARLIFPKGQLEFNFQMDTQHIPRISFTAFGENINPWLAVGMEQPKTRNDFDADIDIEVEMTSSGKSLQEMASNLDGNIYIAIQNGKIRKALMDLIFVDIVGWSIGHARGKKHVDIHCGITDHEINQGLVTTNAFFLDAENFAIAGHGTIDLGSEEIDYVLLPRKKSKLLRWGADPVKIKGPLKNPSTKVLPWKSAAMTYGGLFFGPYIFLGQMAVEYTVKSLENRSNSPCLDYKRGKKCTGCKPND